MPNDIVSAQARAQRLYPRSQGFRGAYVKGAAAAINGRSQDACPYRVDPRKTWGNAWRSAWLHGYKSIRPDDQEGQQ